MRSRAFTNLTGIFPPSVTSRREWSRFSIDHWSRVNASTRAGSARFGVRLVIPYTRGSRTLERMFDASAHAKDLPHAVPVARQESIEFGGDGDQAVFEASMSCVGGRSAAPIATIQWRLTKKERELFI